MKQFAQKMVSDHSQMADKWFKPVAQQLGISEPKGPSKKDKKEIAKLQGLSGDGLRSRVHHDDGERSSAGPEGVQETKQQSAQNPNVKQIAQQGSEVISQHLQLIEQIAKSHNIDGGASSKEIVEHVASDGQLVLRRSQKRDLGHPVLLICSIRLVVFRLSGARIGDAEACRRCCATILK